MQLAQLQSFDQHIQGLRQDRNQRSDADFLEGMDLFVLAEESEFTDKQALIDASSLFITAVQKNRRDPRPYAALGMLFTLLDNKDQARVFLTEAIRLDPENEAPRELLSQLRLLKSTELNNEDRLALLEQDQTIDENFDYDALYDAVERLIKSSLLNLMQQRHAPKPTTEEASLAGLRYTLKELQELKQRIDAQLTIVETEIDCAELRAQLRPLEMLVRNYQRASDTSDEFNLILITLAGLRQRAIELMRASNKHPASGDAELQQLLDDVDGIADRIDHLSSQKFDTSPVEAVYEELVVFIGNLQELFDEA